MIGSSVTARLVRNDAAATQHRSSPGKVMLVMLASAAATFGTTLPPWIIARVHTSLNQSSVEVAGSDAAPAVASLALVAMAASLAVRIAGSKIRWLVCTITLLAAFGMGVSIFTVVTDPAAASLTEVGQATGMEGSAADYTVSFWPWISLVCSLASAVSSIWAALAGRHWGAKRKYERNRALSGEEMDEIDTWDSLTAGNDPTK